MKNVGIAGVTLLGMGCLATVAVWTAQPQRVQAHCQVPCGIYDDAARITRMREDASTIEKAVKLIDELAGQHDAQAFNQAARWVSTKEVHASHIIEVVSQYFLTQKVKPVAPDADGYQAYLKKLGDHHAVMVAAMKTKQSVDKTKVAALRSAIDNLADHY